MYRYAVFQGGGVKGMALVGALDVAERQGVSFEGVGGTSAGAIVAGLYAAGYTASEMCTIMEMDFSLLLDGSILMPWALYRRLGLYKG
jgi:NTE family protein